MIRIGIAGYGNLGRGVEHALAQNPDMELCAIFTRRPPKTITPVTQGVPVFSMEAVGAQAAQLDVMILCGGSATDLPVQGPSLAALVHTVDSFDTHAKIPEYFARMDEVAKSSGKVSLISVGWDPGLFSVQRALLGAILPDGQENTFWGDGVSQGHSDAIRRIDGVADAKQYTCPVKAAVDAARKGQGADLTARQKHLRKCFVVAKEGADREAITQTLVTMPHYFADYDTTVEFVTQQQLDTEHAGLPHGGFMIRTGTSGNGNAQMAEFSLQLASNPEFTSSVMVAYARATYRMAQEGKRGAFTVLDVPPAYISAKSAQQLRAQLL